MNKLLETYKRSLTIKKKSENTIKSYHAELTKFFRWIEEYKGIKFQDINGDTLNSIPQYIIEEEYLPINDPKSTTYNKRLASIRSLYKHLYNRDEQISEKTYKNLGKIEVMKVKSKEPVFLTKNEVKRFFYVVDNSTGKNSLRDRSIIHTFLESGIRLFELTNLKKDNINMETRFITVNGKGGKVRSMKVTKELMELITEYWNHRIDDSDYAFVISTASGNVRKYSDDGVRKMIKTYVSLADIEKNITPHKLRHTCASFYYHQSKDIVKTKEMLGHSNIKTSMIYTHLLVDEEEDKFIDKGLYN